MTRYGFDIVTFDPFFRTSGSKDCFREILDLRVSVSWRPDGEGKIHILKESHDTAWSYIAVEMLPCFHHKIPKRYLAPC